MGGKGEEVAPLQTALNGRPRAGANCCSGRDICTLDGPKWTAQSGGGGGGENEWRTRGATLQTALDGRSGRKRQ